MSHRADHHATPFSCAPASKRRRSSSSTSMARGIASLELDGDG
jgi:hypothetical protein